MHRLIMGNCQYVHHLYTSEATLNGEYYQHLLLPYTRDLGHSEVKELGEEDYGQKHEYNLTIKF
jgi:hypothetical protein